MPESLVCLCSNRTAWLQAHERVITEPLPPVVEELVFPAGAALALAEADEAGADARLDGAAVVACRARRYGL